MDHSWVDSFHKLNNKTLWIKPHFVAPSGSVSHEKLCTEPFWAVRKIAETDGLGNMLLTSVTSSGCVATDVAEEAKVFASSTPVANKIALKTPVLMNTKDLKAGEELVWAFGAKKNKRKLVPIKEKTEGTKAAKVEARVSLSTGLED